ncbi:MAG: tetratricopeptide repeat protein [candidate division WOR-3 bacterium]
MNLTESIRRRLQSLLMVAVVTLGSGCAYFNTFYNAQTYYREGVRLKEQNQQGQAKAKFDKSVEKSALVLSRWPRSRWADDALFLIGMSYYHSGQFTRAIRHLEQLVLAFPKSRFVPDAELYRGLALLRDRQYGSARLALAEVRERYPRFQDVAAFHLAESFVEREEYERALDSMKAFVADFPRSSYQRRAIRALAETCVRQGRWSEAETWYGRLVRMESDAKERTRARLQVARCRLEQGKLHEAGVMAQDVLGRYSDLDEEANLLLGKSQAGMDRMPEALATWQKVRGNNALGAEAAFLAGKYYEEHDDFGKARAFYDTAKMRRADSDHGVLAVKRLSLLSAFARRQSDSMDAAEAAFLLAEVHNLNLGDYDAAMRLYQQVYDSFPATDWAAKALFAKAWIMRNVRHDTSGAEPLLRKLISEFPETEYADESRRWLGLQVPKRKPKSVPVDTATKRPEPEPQSPTEELAEETLEPAGSKRMTERPARPEPLRGVAEDGTGRRRPMPETMPSESAVPAETAPGKARPPTEPFELAIVHFDFDEWRIRAEDTVLLNQSARALTERSDREVTIVGHCDPRGTDAYNNKLGLRRAEAVRDYLVSAGVSRERLNVESAGKSRPISTGPDEYWLDRRVEFRFR